jgi:putative nucleotidyltransferase with HDIG domain
MTATVRRLVALSVAVAAVLAAMAFLFFPIRPEIGGGIGVAYWTAFTLVSSALPVRLPQGTVASVSAAPILASVFLGGPAAAVIVAAIGTTDSREVRGEVPWYGTLYNHASAISTAAAAGISFELILIAGPGESLLEGALGFIAVLVAGAVGLAVSGAFSSLAVATRTGVSLRTVWARDLRAILINLFGLTPVAWLMAQVFLLPNGIGWWATTLFVVPLFTTRLAYHRYVETRQLFEQTIGALANAVDARDKYTRGHSNRVSHISEAMCRVMNLPESEIEKIKWAGLLHDVGKIGIRDNILLKPGPLNREERVLMNQHPTIGAEIVAPASQLAPEAPLIRAHHEWINGSGYPDGLEYADIPLGARIMTIADAYEAMTSSRPYRLTPLTHEQAIAELVKYRGLQFDPEIVPVLVGLDRSILDRPPERPDELPTMLHQDDLVAAAAPGPTVIATGTDEGSKTSRPALASEDAP